MNILVAYEDDREGHNFFSGLADDLLSFLKINKPETLHVFSRANLRKDEIEQYISSLNEKPFLFVAYSHGEIDRLCVNNSCFEFYAKHPDNSYFFSDSVIYTFSCKTGHEFADGVISNGCNCFIGYDDKAWYDLENISTFISIVNSGVKELIKGSNCETAMKKIKDEYNLFIDYYEDGDYIAFSNLSKNYRVLTLKGNGNYMFKCGNAGSC